MGFRIIGQTTARYASPYRTQTLAGATLVFYFQGENATTAEAPSRWGFRRLSGDKLLPNELGRATVASDGSYSAELKGYDGGGLVVVLDVTRFSYAPDTKHHVVGVLGAGAPTLLGENRKSANGRLDIDLNSSSYCSILAALDLWLVAGRVSDCGKQASVPLIGGIVAGFDRDVIQDDNLGTSVTDGTGSFEIFFPGSTFRLIPSLPPPFDHIPGFELIGGPDIYFKVSLGSLPLLEEPPTTGRNSDRENRSNCSYTELCVTTPIWTPQSITLWSRIGNYLVPDGGSLHDFDADGFVNAGKLAFYDKLDFNGQVSQTYLGSPVSYRFVYAEWTTLSTAPAYPTDFHPLTTQITGAPYGDLYNFIGPNPWDYTLTPVAPSPDPITGWIAVNQDGHFIRDVSRMVEVDTSMLVPAIDHPGNDTDGAGSPVPAPEQDRPRKFSFVLEVKTVANSTPQHGVPVTIHINNSAADLRYDLSELSSVACNPITPSGGSITIHPLYTVGHPYLNSYSISVQRQGGTFVTLRTDSYNTSPHTPLWTTAAGESGTFAATYNDVQPCSYRSWMICDRRLTTGYGGVGGQQILRTFCTK
jgi:hypothetical protein